MGDRSRVTVYCRECDESFFENLGFVRQGAEGDVLELVDEGALGGHYDHLPKDRLYHGSAAGHYAYDGFAFACDGKGSVAMCDTSVEGDPFVKVNAHGEVEADDLRSAREYWATLHEVQRLLGEVPPKAREEKR